MLNSVSVWCAVLGTAPRGCVPVDTETLVRERLSAYHPTAGGCFLSFPFLFNSEERFFLFLTILLTRSVTYSQPVVPSWGQLSCTGDICQCLETFIFYITSSGRTYLRNETWSVLTAFTTPLPLLGFCELRC